MNKLKFSRWFLWEDMEKIHYLNFPGVYMIAITYKSLKGKKPHYKDDIRYIGMTNSRGGLKSRLKQFNASIHGKKLRHCGADRICIKLGKYKKWNKKLFVCVHPIRCETNKEKRTPKDLRKMGQCTKLEYDAIAQIKQETGKEPIFNIK